MAIKDNPNFISFAEAKAMIQAFKSAAPLGAQTSGYMPRAAFDDILAQKGCVGIRFYFAKASDGSVTLVFAGQNAEKQVMDNTDNGQALMEFGMWCPPVCDFTDDFK